MTENISFEPARDSDVERLNRIVNEPDVAQYLDLIPPVPLDKTQAFFSSMQAIRASLWSIAWTKRRSAAWGSYRRRKGRNLRMTRRSSSTSNGRTGDGGIGGRAVSFALSKAEGRFGQVEALRRAKQEIATWEREEVFERLLGMGIKKTHIERYLGKQRLPGRRTR